MSRAVRALPAQPAGRFGFNLQWRGVERVTGIEPVYSAWKAAVLPLYYTRAGAQAITVKRAPAQAATSFTACLPFLR